MSNEQDLTIETEEATKKGFTVAPQDTDDSHDDEILMDSEDNASNSSLAPQDQLKKLREKLKKAVEEKQSYLDGWQKERAEFVNARKRDEREKQEFVKFSNESLINDLLPVLDSFTMAFANKEAWEKVDKNWRIGVEYIANQLKKALEDNGVKEIDPIGQKFDPTRDEALEFEVTDDESKNGLVTATIHKGYSYNGRILKAPKVKVAEIKK
jgi:molecular chaperone GrpE